MSLTAKLIEKLPRSYGYSPCERSLGGDATCVQVFCRDYSTRRCQAEQVQRLQEQG